MPKELDRTWQLLDDFAEAARLLRNHTGDPDIAGTVCELALRALGGEHASITSIRSGHFTTIAATSAVPEQADKVQHKVGEGPCLDPVREIDIIRVDDLATDTRWPQFGSAASSELGMHSMITHVVPVDEHARAALNVYSSHPHAFEIEHEKIIAIFGAAAFTAMSAARHQEKSDHLERALHTSRRIGVALGILMATHGVDLDQAWRLLSKASQDSNTKVSDLADQVVRLGHLSASGKVKGTTA